MDVLPAANPKNGRNHRALVKVAAVNDWTIFMDDIMNTLSHNNQALRRFHETIKDAVDPGGVLAPGKSGIWPKRYRELHT